jgi:hypothetical protein
MIKSTGSSTLGCRCTHPVTTSESFRVIGLGKTEVS